MLGWEGFNVDSLMIWDMNRCIEEYGADEERKRKSNDCMRDWAPLRTLGE